MGADSWVPPLAFWWTRSRASLSPSHRFQAPCHAPRPHQATLWLHPHFPWALSFAVAKVLPLPILKSWYFFQGLVPKYYTKRQRE